VHVESLFLGTSDVVRKGALRLVALNARAMPDLAYRAFLLGIGREGRLMRRGRQGNQPTGNTNQAPSGRQNVVDSHDVLVQTIVPKGNLRNPHGAANMAPLQGVRHLEAPAKHRAEFAAGLERVLKALDALPTGLKGLGLGLFIHKPVAFWEIATRKSRLGRGIIHRQRILTSMAIEFAVGTL